MTIETKENSERAKLLFKNLLLDTFINSYHFGTQFTIEFARDEGKYFESKKLPHTLDLAIHTNWTIGPPKSWEYYIDNMNDFFKKDFFIKDEPLLAFWLTVYRWSDNSSVSDVVFSDKNVIIHFKNGHLITLPYTTESGDLSWLLIESKDILSINAPPDWGVKCDSLGNLSYQFVPL